MRTRLRALLPIILTLIACSAYAQKSGVSGKITLKKKNKEEQVSAGEVVVYIDEVKAEIPRATLRQSYVITTKDKQFSPQLMIIPKGATVQFPNRDPIIHNVFSVSGKNRFDAGRYSRGEGKSHTFQNEGLVRVYCNVHHAMNALLYVADNPYFATVDRDGHFKIENLPPGTYQLVALHQQAGQKRLPITVKAKEMTLVEIEMTLRKARVKKHLNKFGKPYKRTRKRY